MSDSESSSSKALESSPILPAVAIRPLAARPAVIGGRLLTLENFIRLSFLLTLLLTTAFLVANASQPLLESYAFRQTQTALTTTYLMQKGFSLAYWTPVIGQGWSIPFEFPIYQELVAIISSVLGSPLTETGRLVSWLFLLLCCQPVYLIIRHLGYSRNAALVTLTLFVGSPTYIEWGSCFMIETTALYFTLWFAYFSLRLAGHDDRRADYWLAGCFLLLALLQKITTALPVAMVFAGLFAMLCWRRHYFSGNWPRLLKLGLMLILPLVIALAWVKYTDMVKAGNAIAAHLTSGSVAEWNYGTLNQRISRKLWSSVLWGRMFRENLGGAFGAGFLLVGLLLLRDVGTRRFLSVALLLAVLPMLIFTNLHIAHGYYQMANLVFLIMAVGVALVRIGEVYWSRRPVLFGAVLCVMFLFDIYHFALSDRVIRSKPITEKNNMTLAVTAYVKANTDPLKPVVWYGFDWSSEAAFYSQRLSLTVPSWDAGLELDTLAHMHKYLLDRPSAVVLCPNPDDKIIRSELLRVFPGASMSRVDVCEVYTLSSA